PIHRFDHQNNNNQDPNPKKKWENAHYFLVNYQNTSLFLVTDVKDIKKYGQRIFEKTSLFS
ncbi:MAG: hypothetical protein JW729_04375, partial [Bacteroidales bacterium]|nr:hypothetical protein [Bacteroidales bacterium]